MNLRRMVVTALVLGAASLALAGCSKSTSTTSPVSLDSTPPSAPTNLVGLYDTGLVKDYLIWTASSSANVASYEVWSYDANPLAGNVGTLVGRVTVGSTFIALPAPAQNSIQYFRMRATSGAGTNSAFSPAIGVQRHGAPVQVSIDPLEDPLPGSKTK